MRLPGRSRSAVVVASVSRRAVAAVIDLWPVALLPAFILGTVLVAVGAARVREWWLGAELDEGWEHEDEEEDRGDEDEGDEGDEGSASLAASVLPGRNQRSRGARMMRIRRVDARTGGPITVRSALIAFAVRTSWREVSSRVVRGPFELRVWTDPQGLPAADRVRVYQEIGRRAERGCLAWLGRSLALAVVPAVSVLWTERKQIIPDWLAGIVVVSDDS